MINPEAQAIIDRKFGDRVVPLTTLPGSAQEVCGQLREMGFMPFLIKKEPDGIRNTFSLTLVAGNESRLLTLSEALSRINMNNLCGLIEGDKGFSAVDRLDIIDNVGLSLGVRMGLDRVEPVGEPLRVEV